MGRWYLRWKYRGKTRVGRYRTVKSTLQSAVKSLLRLQLLLQLHNLRYVKRMNFPWHFVEHMRSNKIKTMIITSISRSLLVYFCSVLSISKSSNFMLHSRGEDGGMIADQEGKVSDHKVGVWFPWTWINNRESRFWKQRTVTVLILLREWMASTWIFLFGF